MYYSYLPLPYPHLGTPALQEDLLSSEAIPLMTRVLKSSLALMLNVGKSVSLPEGAQDEAPMPPMRKLVYSALSFLHNMANNKAARDKINEVGL